MGKRLNPLWSSRSVVGEVIPESKGIVLVEKGRERPLDHPRVDPFWPAFARALAEEKSA